MYALIERVRKETFAYQNNSVSDKNNIAAKVTRFILDSNNHIFFPLVPDGGWPMTWPIIVGFFFSILCSLWVCMCEDEYDNVGDGGGDCGGKRQYLALHRNYFYSSRLSTSSGKGKMVFVHVVSFE